MFLKNKIINLENFNSVKTKERARRIEGGAEDLFLKRHFPCEIYYEISFIEMIDTKETT